MHDIKRYMNLPVAERSGRRPARPSKAPRRLFLRGALGATLGLPLFDFMLDSHGEAYADGEELTRFGLWYWGNGTHPDYWVPSQGANWQPPADGALEALVPLREYVSVISGLSVLTPRHAHHSGAATVCTGGPHLKVADVRDTIVSTFKYPSVDQIAAAHFMQVSPTPYRSLEAAVTRFRGTDEGTTFQYLSHNGSVGGETNVNPSEESPHAFWDRLFNQGTAEPLLRKARARVLDQVGDQIKTLQNQLGTKDKQRLEQHLTSITELEARLNAPLADCSKPNDPGDFPDIDTNEQIDQKNTAMTELMTLALACGLTRSFSIMYSTCGSGVIFPSVPGMTDGHHYTNHTEANPWPKAHLATKVIMGHLAQFLQKLADTPEGANNLLYNSSIFCTSEHRDGMSHSQDDMPMLLCGKGSGRLKGNFHFRQDGGNTTRGLLTALRGAGLPLSEFGYEAGFTNQPILELET